VCENAAIRRTGIIITNSLRKGNRTIAWERSKKAELIVREECRNGKIALEELRMGSRRGKVPRVRSETAERLIKEIGMSLTEVARILGVSTSAISKIINRIDRMNSE